VNEFLSAQL